MRFKQKEYTIPLTVSDAIDVKLFIRSNAVVKFSINYRAEIREKWCQVYRVDSYHDYLHEMKYWISSRPTKLPFIEAYGLNYAFKHYMREVRTKFRRYRHLYENEHNDNR